MHEKTLPECGSVEMWRLTWKGNDVSRSQRSPAKTAKIKEKETQTAVILNVAVQSKVEVGFISAPEDREGLLPYLNGEVGYQTRAILRSVSKWLGFAPPIRCNR